MNSSAPPLFLRERVTEAAGNIASALGGIGHCALLVWGSKTNVEVVDRQGIPLEVCAGLSSPGGRNFLAWARKVGKAQRLRREAAENLAPELAQAMVEAGTDSLALVPLFGDSRALGFVCVGLPATWEGEIAWCPGGDECWCWSSQTPGMLQLAAGNAALRSILKIREKEPPGGIDGLLVLDQESRLLFSYGFLRELPEWNSDQVYGRHIKSLPGGKILAAIGLDDPGRLLWKERRLPGSGSEGIPVEIAAAPLPDEPPGPLASTILFLRDLREPAKSDGKMEGAFLLELGMRVSHSAHQLKGRGNAFHGHGPPESHEVGERPESRMVSWLEGQLEEAGVLLRSALNVADSDHQRGPVDLSVVLKDLKEEYTPDFLEERIQVFPILSPDLPAVLGDGRRLKTAFRVLMLASRNSLHPTGGTIFLRAWEDDGRVFCTVSDDGPGMPESEIDELLALEPLFDEEGGPVPERSFGAVRAVVEDLGGRFHIESHPELWTRFTVMLPASRKADTPVERLPVGLPPAVTVRSTEEEALEVLVVDDNDSIRTILRRVLEKTGHQVTEASDGSQALEMISQQEFDRLMVDVYMPGITVREFFEGLEDCAPGMKDRTIFMTGGIQEVDVREYIQGTGRPALEKPFDLKKMVQTLEG